MINTDKLKYFKVEVEYIDGKIVRFNQYTGWKIDDTGHTLTIKNDGGVHIIPLLNVRDVYISN